MNARDLKIVHESLSYDDCTLLRLYNEAKENFNKAKEVYNNEKHSFDENDYYRYLIAKLSYEFAKEEYDIFLLEIKKRGIDTSNVCLTV